MIQKLTAVFFIIICLVSSIYAEDDSLLDGFEEGNDWQVVNWGDQAILSMSKKEVSQGDYALQINYTPEGRVGDNKGVFIKKSMTGKPEELKKLILDVYNAADSQDTAIALAMDIDEFFESKQIQLKKGWNKNITFDLLASDYKSASSGWAYTTGLKRNLNIGNIMLVFYLGKSQYGSFYLDNIRSYMTKKEGIKMQVPQKKKETSVKNYLIPKIRKIRGQRDNVPCYDLLELTVDFKGTFYDPFDREDIELSAVFYSPDKQIIPVDGFLYSAKLKGSQYLDPVWKIRFAPVKQGKWQYVIKVRNKKGQDLSSLYSFTCKGSKKGFVRIDPRHSRYFQFDSGEFYYPIGQNLGWAAVKEYREYFKKMSENQENWSRIWLVSWNVGLEWKQMGFFHGLGKYNLENARNLDTILDLAEKYGIYLQLVFDFHGAFSTSVNSEWQNNPYNSRNGGPCSRPEDFFTDPAARNSYKRRIRYIIARWGYSTQVLAWELFNEVNFTDSFNTDRDHQWHKEMSEYIKELDPCRHLITTSYYNEFNEKTYSLDSIDFTQMHNYISPIIPSMKAMAVRMKQFRKPYFFAEFGSHSADGIDDKDKQGVFMHAGIWAQFMTDSSGDAMPWWWNTQIGPNNLYFHFKALARFAEGLDRRKYQFEFFDQKLKTSVNREEVTLELMGLKDSRLIMFWLCDAKGMLYNDRKNPLSIANAVVEIKDVNKGRYLVEWWDTYQGKVIKKTVIHADNQSLKMQVPEFVNDIACKIKKQ